MPSTIILNIQQRFLLFCPLLRQRSHPDLLSETVRPVWPSLCLYCTVCNPPSSSSSACTCRPQPPCPSTSFSVPPAPCLLPPPPWPWGRPSPATASPAPRGPCPRRAPASQSGAPLCPQAPPRPTLPPQVRLTHLGKDTEMVQYRKIKDRKQGISQTRSGGFTVLYSSIVVYLHVSRLSRLVSNSVVLLPLASVSNMANPKEKTPMCLVNELARFNKIQPEYKLLCEQGPAHSKVRSH